MAAAHKLTSAEAERPAAAEAEVTEVTEETSDQKSQAAAFLHDETANEIDAFLRDKPCRKDEDATTARPTDDEPRESEDGSDPENDDYFSVAGSGIIEDCEGEDDKRAGRGMYYAVRVGYASPVLVSDDEDNGDIHPRKKRKRGQSWQQSSKFAPMVKIRSAIFLYWEDARQFVDTISCSSDHKAEYSAFDSFQEAEEYLIKGERQLAFNVARVAEAVSFGAHDNSIETNTLRAEGNAVSQGQLVTANPYGGNLGTNVLESALGGFFANRPMANFGGIGTWNQGLMNLNQLAALSAIAQAESIPELIETTETTIGALGELRVPNIETIPPNAEASDPSPEPKKKEKRSRKPRLTHWDEMYKKLLDYKNANDGIPEGPEEEQDNPEAKELCRWCNLQLHRQRRWAQGYTGSGKLTLERIEKLRELGLPLAPSYEEMYEKLAKHKSETGTLDVNKDEDDELFTWTKEQKKMLLLHFQEKPVPLSDEQIENLKSLGYDKGRSKKGCPNYVVDVGLEEKKWGLMLDSLLKWKEENGTFAIPNDTSSLPKEVKVLQNWVQGQRKEYRNLQDGKESSLTAQRLQRLTAIGLDLKSRPPTLTWEERMQSLREFVSEHGHCKPTRDHPLSGFVSNIRTFYREKEEGKPSCLTDERVNDLLEIGFVFKAGKTPKRKTKVTKTWDERFEELLAYKEEHGHTLVPQLSGPLGVWAKQQRTEYRRMKAGRKTPMNAEKALRLTEIGFHFDAERFKGRNRQVE